MRAARYTARSGRVNARSLDDAPPVPEHALPSRGADHDVVCELASHPSLVADFDRLDTVEGVRDAFADPFAAGAMAWLARLGGAPVGFCHGSRLPAFPAGARGVLRIGVPAPWRRRGIGTRLLERSTRALRESGTDIGQQIIGAWMPSEAAEGFAACHGFVHSRWFWAMRRASEPCPAPQWPEGIEQRVFDASERAFEDWTRTYERSFADHFHFVPTTVDEARGLAALSDFRPDGLMLAYREGRCVGFCRNSLKPTAGEVAVLGVTPEARGIGLGRALLRWGVRWLESTGAHPIELRVDGQNETALELYRSESFATVRTRELWERALPSD